MERTLISNYTHIALLDTRKIQIMQVKKEIKRRRRMVLVLKHDLKKNMRDQN